MTARSITIEVDSDDERAIIEAISYYQAHSHSIHGQTIVAEGTSSLRGAILGEICRAWIDYRRTWRRT